MEIIIKSVENGWESQRRIELPEDEGLVKSILRIVKRRTTTPELEGEVAEEQVDEKTPAGSDATREEPPAERTTFETGWRGFLILTCKACGKDYVINAKEPMKETDCKACGHVTALEEMAPVEMYCPDCGRTWRYKTNSERAEVSDRCIQCGEPMVSEWNSKLRRYMPLARAIAPEQ